MNKETASARMMSSLLLGYPDDVLIDRLPQLHRVVAELPEPTRAPLSEFLAYLESTPLLEAQQHFVTTFDMKRKACPYLTYWTDGDTRNRGRAILHFKQAYLEAGFTMTDEEMADHLAVVLEFSSVCSPELGDVLLLEHAGPIGLLAQALHTMDSPYAHVLDAVVATLPPATPALREAMARLAASGPPAEQVGLEPFGVTSLPDPMGARR